jgi:iron complex transport system substrate-binding protein
LRYETFSLVRGRLPLVVVALLFAACSSPAATTTTVPETTTTLAATTTSDPGLFPVTVSADNGEVTIPARPRAIVSLSAAATEILFAIGAADQVVAVDSLSNYPPEAPVTDLAAFTPNVEAVAAYAPDLVVIAYDANDLLAGLNELGIPTLVMAAPPKLDDAWSQYLTLGLATGRVTEAERLIVDTQAELQAIAADLPGEGLTYYYELDNTSYYSATSATFIGSLLATIGLENIADPADADGAAFGYPQLSAEFIIAADPDLILLADTVCCQQNAETVAARPGWGAMKALANGGVVELNDDIASRWGPRIVDLLREVAEAARAVAGG